MLANIDIGLFEFISLATCIFFSGFFSGAEAVLMSLGVDRARQLIQEGGSRASAMSFMLEKPNELLTTILVGNNIVNILAASLTTTIAARIFKSDAIGISTGVTTIIILIFGEIIPKTFARTHAERLSVFIIYILRFKYYTLYPFINFMVWFARIFLGENAELTGRMVTKNDIEYMINKAEKEKTMDSKQIDLLNSILDFPTIKVKDIMIPRLDIRYVQADVEFFELIESIKDHNYTRYPVADGELENTIGFLHAKDLAFVRGELKGSFDIKKILKAPFFVYEHMKIQSVFDHMNRKKSHMALVKDENGLVVGIVTLEDIIEEVMGEIQDEHDEEEMGVLAEQQKFDLREGITVEGTISLRDLYNDYDIKIPLNDNFSTLAGFILDMLGNTFPKEGQIIVWKGLTFDLAQVDNYEIRQVKIKDGNGEKHYFSKREAQDVRHEEDNQNGEASGQHSSSQNLSLSK